MSKSDKYGYSYIPRTCTSLSPNLDKPEPKKNLNNELSEAISRSEASNIEHGISNKEVKKPS